MFLFLYLRLLVDGKFETKFWGIVKVTDATGPGLRDTIKDFFTSQDVPMTSLTCMATDGASAMTGDQGGCGVLVRHLANAFMLLVHCIAHRHALACADAAKDNSIAEYFEAVLHDIIS